MRHLNIPVFIPHLGCPQMCVFCDQNRISGKESGERDFPGYARRTIDEALKTVDDGDDVEIAFFGGSFTGIDRELMISLLDIAESYIDKGPVSHIRLSTRPDYISAEILDILSRYHVRYIELGVQSTSDAVLEKCRRGHTAKQSIEALKMIRESGFESVGQMMTGLPGSSPEDEINTARDIINCGASAARIYPIVIFRDTELYEMVKRNEYVPLSPEELVRRTADVLEEFVGAGIPVIKIGLHSGPGTENAEGSYHPAMGELAEGLVCFRIISSAAAGKDTRGKNVTVYVPTGFVSKAVGQRGIYRDRLRDTLGVKKLGFAENPALSPYEFEINVE